MSFQGDVKPVLNGMAIGGVSQHLIKAVLRDAAEQVMDHIISGWPVDTGESLAGWGTREESDTWLVVNDVEYVQYVWDGIAQVLFDAGLAAARGPAQTRLQNLLQRQQLPPGMRQWAPVTPRATPQTAVAIKIADAAARVEQVTKRLYAARRISRRARSLFLANKVREGINLLLADGAREEAQMIIEAARPR